MSCSLGRKQGYDNAPNLSSTCFKLEVAMGKKLLSVYKMQFLVRWDGDDKPLWSYRLVAGTRNPWCNHQIFDGIIVAYNRRMALDKGLIRNHSVIYCAEIRLWPIFWIHLRISVLYSLVTYLLCDQFSCSCNRRPARQQYSYAWGQSRVNAKFMLHHSCLTLLVAPNVTVCIPYKS